MDDEGLNISPQEIQKLTPNDYKELQQFLANEGQKTQVQKSKLFAFNDFPIASSET